MEPYFNDLINRFQNLSSENDEKSWPAEDRAVIHAMRNHLGREPFIEDLKKCIRFPHPALPTGDYCLVYDLEKLGIVHFKENMEGVMFISFQNRVPDEDPTLLGEAKPHSLTWNKFPSSGLN